MRHSALQVAWALLAASAAARVVPLSPAKLPWKLHSKTLAAAPAAAASESFPFFSRNRCLDEESTSSLLIVVAQHEHTIQF